MVHQQYTSIVYWESIDKTKSRQGTLNNPRPKTPAVPLPLLPSVTVKLHEVGRSVDVLIDSLIDWCIG